MILSAPGAFRTVRLPKRFPYAKIEVRGLEPVEPFDFELMLNDLPEGVCVEPMNESLKKAGDVSAKSE